MLKPHFCIILLLLLSCNHIQKGNSLSKADIDFIKSLHLLDDGEKIEKFYSNYKKKVAGNFFTDRRLAVYWVDTQYEEKNERSFAFYKDIKAIDTVYDVDLTYCPYLRVTKYDGTQFKVCVEGSKREVKAFFEEALNEWQKEK